MKIMFSLLLILMVSSYAMGDKVVIIANKNVSVTDKDLISKIYTGKLIMIGKVHVLPINQSNRKVKSEFLQEYLHMNEKKYIAYWTVRQYIGKGVPPKELESAKAIIEFVEGTKGAIGYVSREELEKNLTDNIIVLFE